MSKLERVYGVIRERILNGQYGPGHRLVIDSLAEELGVSALPIREAIRRLEAEGLVLYRVNAGATVATADPAQFAEGMAVLAVLEGYATALTAPLLTEDDFAGLEAATDRMRECMERLDVLGFGQANRDFHAIVYERCPNGGLVKSLGEAARRLDHVRRTVFTHIPYRGVQSIAEHRELIGMLRAGASFGDVEAFARQHKLNTVEAFRRWHAEAGEAARAGAGPGGEEDTMSEATATQARATARAEVAPARHYVDGEFRDGAEGRTFETLDPSTNEPITVAAEGTAPDVDAAVAAARRAFDDGPWRTLAASERAAVLRRIAAGIREHADELIALEVTDVGMPIRQMRGQAARAADNFDYFAGVITELAGTAHLVGSDFLNYSVHKPVGVAGLITPWNSPLMLSTWKIAPCLAAGNTCVLKPAEWSPLTASKLAEILDEAGLPPGVFNVVHGFGETAGAPLVAHPGVDIVSFTGETTTGSAIMANGAQTLKRYSFELGGKSPVVVFADADFERAVDGVVYQIFTLNGQRCTAGSRLLVEDSIYEDFVAAVAERAQAIRVGDPFDDATELGPLIRPEHHERVMGFLDSARSDGTRQLAGGGPPEWARRGNYLQATLFADVTPEMPIFTEEVFGPVLVATPFSGDDEAVRLANATRYGLAGYVWTDDVRRAHTVAQAIDSGMVWVNAQNVRDLSMPFGGMKDSGIGREGGHYSFEFYCELQAVHIALGEHRIPRLGLGDGGH